MERKNIGFQEMSRACAGACEELRGLGNQLPLYGRQEAWRSRQFVLACGGQDVIGYAAQTSSGTSLNIWSSLLC